MPSVQHIAKSETRCGDPHFDRPAPAGADPRLKLEPLQQSAPTIRDSDSISARGCRRAADVLRPAWRRDADAAKLI